MKRISVFLCIVSLVAFTLCGCGGGGGSSSGGYSSGGGSGGGSTATGPSVATVTSSATTGSRIVITGSGFGTNGGSNSTTGFVSFMTSSGTFSGNPLMYDSWADTQIVCYVPDLTAGQTYQVRVTYSGVCSSTSNMGVGINQVVINAPVNAPQIVDVVPTTAAAGTNVTINGSSFGAQLATSYVFYRSSTDWKYHPITAIVTWTDTQIVITLPAGLASGSSAVLFVHTDQGGNSNGIGPAIQ